MDTPTWYAVATLTAIVVGPILAVLITRLIDERREQKKRKSVVFTNLMQTRGIRLDALHVAALNIVELEFYSDKNVRSSFKEYVQHLSAPMPDVDEQERFFDRRSDLFVDLLSTMGKSLGYQFDKRDLDRLSYVPQGWNDSNNLQQENAQLLNHLLAGRAPLPVATFLNSEQAVPELPDNKGSA